MGSDLGLPKERVEGLVAASFFERFDPCFLLQSRCEMPAPSIEGSISPVSTRAGSWSALAPHLLLRGSVMSTGMWHLMHTGSHVAMTWATHCLYPGPRRWLGAMAGDGSMVVKY